MFQNKTDPTPVLIGIVALTVALFALLYIFIRLPEPKPEVKPQDQIDYVGAYLELSRNEYVNLHEATSLKIKDPQSKNYLSRFWPDSSSFLQAGDQPLSYSLKRATVNEVELEGASLQSVMRGEVKGQYLAISPVNKDGLPQKLTEGEYRSLLSLCFSGIVQRGDSSDSFTWVINQASPLITKRVEAILELPPSLSSRDISLLGYLGKESSYTPASLMTFSKDNKSINDVVYSVISTEKDELQTLRAGWGKLPRIDAREGERVEALRVYSTRRLKPGEVLVVRLIIPKGYLVEPLPCPAY